MKRLCLLLGLLLLAPMASAANIAVEMVATALGGGGYHYDVVDIALTAVASGPTYATVTVVGDNVAANDQVYNQVFPYLATPHAGPSVSQRQAP